ncbi:hypothetical protein [Yinghuangia soli]|uniref:Uncharacterized protein n=1 Tax=Yinghuangia soli TaxID=2908204 RepID=A0AA41Q8P7_9ACTN|nr:hypothetical protein [Yinghuangia soli]MCF2533276.1 hypothetical protein [Yinghuangia soli]
MTDAVPPPHADFVVDAAVTVEQELPLLEALDAIGFTVRTRVLPTRRADPLTWLILIAVPLSGFLGGFGTKAGEDSYRKFTDGLRAVLRRHNRLTESSDEAEPDAGSASEPASEPEPEQPSGTAPRHIVLQDPASGLRILIDHELTPEAYAELLSLDLTTYQLGPLHYDHAQKRWRSTADEALAG